MSNSAHNDTDLPPLDVTDKDRRNAHWHGCGSYSMHPERAKQHLFCRERQLLAALQALAAATTELKRLRNRAFNTHVRKDSANHSTACTIWGDSGQGATAEDFAEPLSCNCGALSNYERRRAEAAEAKIAEVEKERDDLANFLELCQ